MISWWFCLLREPGCDQLVVLFTEGAGVVISWWFCLLREPGCDQLVVMFTEGAGL